MAILERKIIDVKGIETAYVEKDSGADMLLLHGGGGCSADDFHLNVGPLSERFPSQRRVARKLPQPLSGYSLLAVHVFASESRLTPPASCEIRSSVTWMQSSLSLPSLVANAYQTATAPRATVNAVASQQLHVCPPVRRLGSPELFCECIKLGVGDRYAGRTECISQCPQQHITQHHGLRHIANG